MNNVDPFFYFEESKDFPNLRVLNVVDRLSFLTMIVTNPVLVLKERREIAACYVGVLVDGRAQYRPSLITIPCGVVRAAAKKRDAVWRSADDQGRLPVSGVARAVRYQAIVFASPSSIEVRAWNPSRDRALDTSIRRLGIIEGLEASKTIFAFS